MSRGNAALPLPRMQRQRASASRGHGLGLRRLAVLGLTSAILTTAVAGAYGAVMSTLPSLDDLVPVDAGANSSVRDREGRLLGIIPAETNRIVVPARRIPPMLAHATVAIEDRRFFEHDGIDYARLVGATLHNLTGGSGRQGGSTITMQLIKNRYYPDAPRTLWQKVIEARLAGQMEERASKRAILTQYLNGVSYGPRTIGVHAAALAYFNRPVWAITLPQAALLAGLPQAPSTYNPLRNPDAARGRRNTVLGVMADQGYITRAQATRAQRSGLGLRRSNVFTRVHGSDTFAYARDQAIATYGRARVHTGGMVLRTTIDSRLQVAAEEVIRRTLDRTDDPAAAIVMLDARTGAIRALASSRTPGAARQFNYAAQSRRQAGSTFKTFALAQAVADGIDPFTATYTSRPINIPRSRWGPIRVRTYGDSYRGTMTLDEATLASDNTVYTQLTLEVGPARVARIARRMGINSPLLPVPSIGLGAGSVTPLEMAAAYAPLANGGWRVTPHAFTARGSRLPDERLTRRTRTRVIAPDVAHTVTRILTDNVASGTGTAAQLGVPQAGKTGTTDDYTDAWFVGYTPRYVTAVWMGYPNDDGQRRSMSAVRGVAVAGGTFPARMWREVMAAVPSRERDGRWPWADSASRS